MDNNMYNSLEFSLNLPPEPTLSGVISIHIRVADTSGIKEVYLYVGNIILLSQNEEIGTLLDTVIELDTNRLVNGYVYLVGIAQSKNGNNILCSHKIFINNKLISIPDIQITINPNKTYQTISGWEATTGIGQQDPDYRLYQQEVVERAVHELGINRLRLEVPSGVENSTDYWGLYGSNDIDYATFRANRYATVLDNDSLEKINWEGFHFTKTDLQMETVVLPIKKLLEAQGERLFLNVCYVAFTRQITTGANYHHTDPDRYAKFVLATFLHLRDKYEITPDSWEMLLEPDQSPQTWNSNLLIQALVKTGSLLNKNGFYPQFIAPSTTSMAASTSWISPIQYSEEARNYLTTLSYHRYGGVSDEALKNIREISETYGLTTSMSEHIGATYKELYADLNLANNSAWQQFIIANFGTDSPGGKYYWVEKKDGQAIVHLGNRSKYLRQYFKFIRQGAVRIESKSNNDQVSPTAFINKNGTYVVVVNTTSPKLFSITGLPQGLYGIKYTTNDKYDIDKDDVVLENNGLLTTDIPGAGVITIYGK